MFADASFDFQKSPWASVVFEFWIVLAAGFPKLALLTLTAVRTAFLSSCG